MNIRTLTVGTVLSLLCSLALGKNCSSIVQIASGNKDFSTLVAALTAADLVDDLSGKGPFTVFAPTNAAFAKLDNGTLQGLLLPANKAELVNVLLYHVAAGAVFSKDLQNDSRLVTLQGTKVRVRTQPVVKINRSTVTTADIKACNGVIHAIDKVLIPTTSRVKQIGQCSKNATCSLCEGDCDSDDECKGDLVCFKRRPMSFKKVPGCRGGGSDPSGTDYCINPLNGS
jgi:uncharacterized surface protein with fasciclin (FAS1) repeats